MTSVASRARHQPANVHVCVISSHIVDAARCDEVSADSVCLHAIIPYQKGPVLPIVRVGREATYDAATFRYESIISGAVVRG